MKTALDHAELDADQLHTIETCDYHGSLCGENGLDQAEHDAGQLRTSETRDFRGSLCSENGLDQAEFDADQQAADCNLSTSSIQPPAHVLPRWFPSWFPSCQHLCSTRICVLSSTKFFTNGVAQSFFWTAEAPFSHRAQSFFVGFIAAQSFLGAVLESVRVPY